jgi:hypothetical protein
MSSLIEFERVMVKRIGFQESRKVVIKKVKLQKNSFIRLVIRRGKIFVDH